MTIGIQEAARRKRMSSYCVERNRYHHAKCHGYRRVAPGELEFCECECHSTREEAIAP